MGHVQFIINSRRKAQTATPSASAIENMELLPGFGERGVPKNPALEAQKKEYNRLLQLQIDLEKKINSQKGNERKATRALINRMKKEKRELLARIIVYNATEEKFGFKEDGDGF